MLDGEKSSDDERQKKLAMVKYTYEQVLSDQAEQVNTKRNNTDNLTAYGQKMITDSNIINMNFNISIINRREVEVDMKKCKKKNTEHCTKSKFCAKRDRSKI